MLYHLFEYLKTVMDFPGSGLMQYISVRAVCASLLSIILSLIFGKKIIRMLQRRQIGEEIRDLGLEGQLQKKGTPTMGGIIILMSILIPVLLFCNLTNFYVILLIITTLWLGGLGFADDYIKVYRKDKNGLSEKKKLIGQILLGIIVGGAVLFHSGIHVMPDTTIPFVKSHEFNYSSLSPFSGTLGEIFTWAVYIIMIILVITACSNASNLTDGMDGLTTGISAIVGTALGVLAYLSGNINDAGYLNIMYIPGSGEVTIVFAAFVGALIGFLWYNSYPAQVFMGDTGSLALGGIIGVAAILIKKELLIPILCGVFFVESLSVIIQRGYFRYTKKKYGEGRRVFKMTPLHHHFQKEGIDAITKRPARAIPEAKIVVRFWIVSILLAVITIITLKIR